jgi:uncharacterized membrane protein YccC
MASVNPVAEQTSVLHVARTTVAALTSLLLSRALHSPEPYWATITTIVVMQSSLGAAWQASRQRFAGTVLGALLGGVLASCVPSSLLAFALGVVSSGLVCLILGLDRAAYRFAGITVAIIVLVERHTSGWVIAAHRSVEVSLGIAVALVLTAVWPEPVPEKAAQ